MLIGIPVDDNCLETEVCFSYGRCPYFMLYNSDTKEAEFIENKAAQAQGGAGITASQMLVDSEVKTVITQRLGKNASDVLVAADIRVMQCGNGKVMDQIAKLEANELKNLVDVHAGFHGRQG